MGIIKTVSMLTISWIFLVGVSHAQNYQLNVIKDINIKVVKKESAGVPVCQENGQVGEIDCLGRLYVDRAILEGLIGGNSYTFHGETFNTYADNKINTFHVSDMSEIFSSVEPLYEISNWDVRNVENMYRMFYYSRFFNQPLNSWDVDNVTNMREAFFNARSFNQPLNSWNVNNVLDMYKMFSGFNDSYKNAFNQNISNWNVCNVRDITSLSDFSPYSELSLDNSPNFSQNCN